MERCAFAVDEHVPRAWVSALESNGFSVRSLPRERVGETDDAALLRWSTNDGRSLITNDRDFLELDRTIEHEGIVMYSDPSLSPGSVARGIRRIDTQFTPAALRGKLVWLEECL